jgi:LmbE family N-acetylglucosaminyl deacetylase
MVTVFSESKNATPPFKERRSATEITDIRKEEDELFASLEGLPLMRLGLPDSGIRGESNDGPQHTLDDASKHSVFTKVKLAIAKVIGPAIGHSLIYVPLGILGHIDHRMVRDAARQIVAESGKRGALRSLRYYEDLPYAAFATEHQIRQLARMLISPSPQFQEVSLKGVWGRKRKAAQIYASQLKPFTLKALADHSSSVSNGDLPEIERVWLDDDCDIRAFRPRSMDMSKLGMQQSNVQPLHS